MEVGVHAGLEHGDLAELVELAGVGVEIEGAGDEDIEARVAAFSRALDQVVPLHGAELGADEDPGAEFGGRWLVISGRFLIPDH